MSVNVEQPAEKADTETDERKHAEHEQDRRSGDGGGHLTHPADGSGHDGRNIGDNGGQSSSFHKIHDFTPFLKISNTSEHLHSKRHESKSNKINDRLGTEELRNGQKHAGAEIKHV